MSEGWGFNDTLEALGFELVLCRCDEEWRIKPEVLKAITSVVYGIPNIGEFKTTTPMSELYLGELFRHSAKNLFKYCKDTNDFLAWDGRKWAVTDRGNLADLAEGIVKEKYRLCEDKEELKFWRKNMTLSKCKNMVELAQNKMAVQMINLDRDSTLINCTNGIVDIAKNHFIEHDPKYMMTKMSNVAYDKAKLCPNWLSFLEIIFQKDWDLIEFIQKAVGYSITARVGIPVFFILYGRGANGKSTFMNAIQHVIGDYFAKLPATSLMEQRNDDIPHDIAGLRNARFVSASETKIGRHLDEAKIKQLTGEKTIKVRHLYKEFFELPITFKIWFMSNNKPTIKGIDEGTWRRIRLIPFSYEIPEAMRVADYEEKFLYEEASGILNWAIEGYQKLERDGFNPPSSVLASTEEYRKEEDFIGEWIDEYCDIRYGVRAKTTELYNDFKRTTRTNIAKKRFTEYLKLQGFEYSQGSGNYNYWDGITRKEEFCNDELY